MNSKELLKNTLETNMVSVFNTMDAEDAQYIISKLRPDYVELIGYEYVPGVPLTEQLSKVLGISKAELESKLERKLIKVYYKNKRYYEIMGALANEAISGKEKRKLLSAVRNRNEVLTVLVGVLKCLGFSIAGFVALWLVIPSSISFVLMIVALLVYAFNHKSMLWLFRLFQGWIDGR